MNLPRRASLVRPFRSELFGRSLSARVLWLTVAIILIVELIILMPSLGRERQSWLWDHITRAHLAAFSATRPGMLDQPMTDALLQLSDTVSIKLMRPGHADVMLTSSKLVRPSIIVTLPDETLLYSTWRSDVLVLGLAGPQIEVRAPSPLEPNNMLDIVVNAHELAAYLRVFTFHIALLSVITALVTGLLLFAVLDRLLVRPMRIMTASIVGFRQDPEQDGQSDLTWLGGQRNDEISRAARELKVMQDEMRAALWRNARLAAVGTSVAKISHDLRNILSSALLVADRLQETSDPAAKRAANTLIPAVERAAKLVSRTVDFAREGPPAITRSAVRLSELVDEATSALRPEDGGVAIENLVPANLVLALDRAQIYRVLVNLMRNAAEAGAAHITLSIEGQNGTTRLKMSDDGPGLPLKVQENLFKPFTGSGRRGGTGLGLAIARDLIRAHGGELTLAATSPRGTVFILELAVSETPG